MLCLPAFRKLLAEPQTYMAVRHVCADGAPWKKPTALVANHHCILQCNARCPGCRWHQPLQGKAPNGRSWTSIASPYWPAFARKMVLTWSWAKDLPRDRSASHLAGWATSTRSTVRDTLEEADFQPSGGRHTSVIGHRVASGIQPIRRALPQLIPPGLSPEFHLEVAHATPHPFLNPPHPPSPSPMHCRIASRMQAR